MFKSDVGKGGVYAYEVHEVKQSAALVRVPFYLINVQPPVTMFSLVD